MDYRHADNPVPFSKHYSNTSKGITMTDKIIISRKEIEDAIDTLYIETFSGEPYIAGTRKILALLDKAEVSELVGYKVTGKLGERCSFKSSEVKKGDIIYTTPQPSRITELEAEIARLKAIP